jgi:hypothetical protein
MPHSLSPPPSSHSPDHDELPDAPAEESQEQEMADEDEKVEEDDDFDLVGEHETGPESNHAPNGKTPETKIRLEEDLFGADDSDDADLLASSMPEVKGESSPVAPMYG